MDEFYKALADFSSVYWWISVVLVGIVINLFGSGLQRIVGSFWGSVKAKNFAKSEREKKYFAQKVFLYRANPVFMAIDAQSVTGMMIFSLVTLLASFAWFMGVGAFLLSRSNAGAHFGVVGALFVFFWLFFTAGLAGLSQLCVKTASRIAKPLDAARRQIELGLLEGEAQPVLPLPATSEA